MVSSMLDINSQQSESSRVDKKYRMERRQFLGITLNLRFRVKSTELDTEWEIWSDFLIFLLNKRKWENLLYIWRPVLQSLIIMMKMTMVKS